MKRYVEEMINRGLLNDCEVKPFAEDSILVLPDMNAFSSSGTKEAIMALTLFDVYLRAETIAWERKDQYRPCFSVNASEICIGLYRSPIEKMITSRVLSDITSLKWPFFWNHFRKAIDNHR